MAAQFEIQVPGSNGNVYTIKRARNGQSWYCSCPSWRYAHVAPALRSCKHIRALSDQFAAQVAAAR